MTTRATTDGDERAAGAVAAELAALRVAVGRQADELARVRRGQQELIRGLGEHLGRLATLLIEQEARQVLRGFEVGADGPVRRRH